MKPTAWQKQDLRTNNIPPNSTLHKIREQIEPYSESPYLDALVLLTHITSKSKSNVLTHPTPELTGEQSEQLEISLHKIKDGISLPYVLGTWEFYKLNFKITPDVLIPRPESEWLVEKGLSWLNEHPQQRTCLDLGTGSGCLAVALAKNKHDLKVFATDMSYQALLIARENANHHDIQEQIDFAAVDLLNGIKTKVDLLVANLPYIPTNKLKNLAVYQSEPRLALDGGQDGLSYIKEVLIHAPSILNPDGLILLELDESSGEQVLELTRMPFPDAEVLLIQDLSNQDRYIQIQT